MQGCVREPYDANSPLTQADSELCSNGCVVGAGMCGAISEQLSVKNVKKLDSRIGLSSKLCLG